MQKIMRSHAVLSPPSFCSLNINCELFSRIFQKWQNK